MPVYWSIFYESTFLFFSFFLFCLQLEGGDGDRRGAGGDDLDPLAIDAFWLQREINKFCDDAVVRGTKWTSFFVQMHVNANTF